MRRSTIHCVIAAAGLLAAVLVLPATPARAGQYKIEFCRSWDTNAPGVAFQDVTGFNANGCGQSGALQYLSGTQTVGNAEIRNIDISVPADRPGLRIDRAEIQCFGAASVGGGGGGFLHIFDQFGARIDGAQSGTTRTVDLVQTPGNRKLSVGVVCTAAPCSFSGQNVIEVQKARFTVADEVPPTAAITANALPTGARSVTFDAADADSGVAAATVLIGSVPVASLTYPCATSDWSPCARSRPAQAVEVDTAKAPAGGALRLVVRDAHRDEPPGTVVRAGVSLKVSRRSVGRRGRVTFSGRVSFPPRKGVQVELQALERGIWAEFKDLETDARGRSRFSYRFSPRTRNRRIAFRAHVADRTYPFAAANSRPAVVRVR